MIPSNVVVHQQSKVLELSYENGNTYRLPFELLRVLSPSAEVQGHGPGQETLQAGKQDVTITDIRPIGNYAIALTFSDGHDSGIYSWDLLYKLGSEFPLLWSAYLEKLATAGLSRKPPLTH